MKFRLISAAIALCVAATQSHAFEEEEYRSLVAETVLNITQGDVDVAHLISIQENLVRLGVAGVREFGHTNPAYSEIMSFVAANAAGMSEMTLEEVELAWHEGSAFAEIGVNFHDLDHDVNKYCLKGAALSPIERPGSNTSKPENAIKPSPQPEAKPTLRETLSDTPFQW